jgi:hypothetical protein
MENVINMYLRPCLLITCSWEAVGPAATMSAKLDLGPAWQPRSIARMAQLQLELLQQEFDFAGVLLWAGEVIASECGLQSSLLF